MIIPEKSKERLLNLMEETLMHFSEGARSVKAYSNEKTYIITRTTEDPDQYWITLEEPGFPKTKTNSLSEYFHDVFGIEANY
jgi:hypothetical protein